jgi:hypothetical protein
MELLEGIVTMSSHERKVLEPLRVLHPEDGGYVTFHAQKGENPFGLITALRPRDLGGLFPDHIKSLVRDAYYSINGMRQPWCNAKLVANLNAVWLDIDYHDSPDPLAAAAGGLVKVFALAETGQIPQPTLYVRSGRGVWVFWRLRDVDGHALSTRDPHIRPLWARLGRGIADFIGAAGLPVDGNALTLERRARMPESINSNTERKVKYTVNLDQDGEPPSYTLPDLARWFNVPETLTLAPPPVIKPRIITLQPCRTLGAPAPSGHNSGQRALRLRRLRDLETLMELRGGRFRDGCRNYAATLFGALMRGAADRVRLVSNFCRDRCAPPLRPYEVGAALKAFSNRRFKITDLKIGQWLEVTSAEAANLEGGDKYLKRRVSVPPAGLPMKRRQRREIISEMYATGEPPTIPQIADRLRDAGVEAAIGTIWNDIDALGLLNPRRHKTPSTRLPLLEIISNKRGERGDSPIYVKTENAGG